MDMPAGARAHTGIQHHYRHDGNTGIVFMRLIRFDTSGAIGIFYGFIGLTFKIPFWKGRIPVLLRGPL